MSFLSLVVCRFRPLRRVEPPFSAAWPPFRPGRKEERAGPLGGAADATDEEETGEAAPRGKQSPPSVEGGGLAFSRCLRCIPESAPERPIQCKLLGSPQCPGFSHVGWGVRWPSEPHMIIDLFCLPESKPAREERRNTFPSDSHTWECVPACELWLAR